MASFHYYSMAIQAMFQKGVFAHLRESGLSAGQPKILDALHIQDGVPQKTLAAMCHIEPASLTTLLNGMVERGLVERRSLHGNRKTSYIFLTEQGRAQYAAVAQAFEQMEGAAFRDISEEEAAQFMNTFAKIYDNLCTERSLRS